MRDIIAAAGMMRSVIGDAAGNKDRVRRLAARAVDGNAGLLVLPEACLTGYTVRESMSPWAEPLDGPIVQGVVDICREFDITISAGMVESCGGEACHLLCFDRQRSYGFQMSTHPGHYVFFTPGDKGYSILGFDRNRASERKSKPIWQRKLPLRVYAVYAPPRRNTPLPQTASHGLDRAFAYRLAFGETRSKGR